jgi:hypothetical protein
MDMPMLTPLPAAVRAAARGLVGAMAMTGVRTFTESAGILVESPPEAIVAEHAPQKLRRLGEGHRTAITELCHWAFGAAGGAMFSALPQSLRKHPLTGPAYGLAIWLSFEIGLAPLLGLQHAKAQRPVSRAVLALDHIMYGIVVAGHLAPEQSPSLHRRSRSHRFARLTAPPTRRRSAA